LDPSSRAVRRSSTVLAGFLVGSWLSYAPATTAPPKTINSHGFQAPFGDSRTVYPFSKKAPTQVLDFLKNQAIAWRIRWDAKLETPRFLLPLKPYFLASPETVGPEPDKKALVDSISSFVDENANLLGITSAHLGEAYMYRVANSQVLVLHQVTPGGIPVRGANLRAMILPDGSLGWAKCFLVRSCADPSGAVLDRARVESQITSSGGTVYGSVLQMGFPGDDPKNAIPIWSQEVIDEKNDPVHYIVGAISGEVLARRRVVKYFDYQGVMEGKSPARDDIFAGPQSGEPVNSPLDGAVIRNIAGHELGFTDAGGVFHLEAPQNPSLFRVSLESGFIDPEAKVERMKAENGYVMSLQIKPLGLHLEENQLLPEEDVDQDGVPDLEIFGFADTPLLGIFNAATPSDLYVERGWWLQSYHHARRMLHWAERTMRHFKLSTRDFLPLHGLRVRPTLAPRREEYQRPLPKEPDIATILTSPIMNAGTLQDPMDHEVVPTRLLHEVGHHVFFSLTSYGEVEPSGIEEAIADLLTGFADESCKILYEGDRQVNRPTPLGFCLGAGNKSQDGWRADLADAFWKLEESIPLQEREQVARALLFYFLALHRVSAPEDHIFDLTDDIFDMLIVTDRLLFGENGFFEQGIGHEGLITSAFRGKRFVDAAFIRGDANADQLINISDAISTLNFLFLGAGPGHICMNGMDTNDDGEVNLADPVRVLMFLFLGGAPLAEPFPFCGLDPDQPGASGNLGCFDATCAR
jgi:hypothetical protein